MTILFVAFEPRQWPPHSVIVQRVTGKGDPGSHTGLVTIAIRVIAAKQGIGSVTVDDFVEVSNGFARRGISKVLSVVL